MSGAAEVPGPGGLSLGSSKSGLASQELPDAQFLGSSRPSFLLALRSPRPGSRMAHRGRDGRFYGLGG